MEPDPQTVRSWLEAISHNDDCYEGCAQFAQAAIKLLNESAPQCLNDPPSISHRLVPDHA